MALSAIEPEYSEWLHSNTFNTLLNDIDKEMKNLSDIILNNKYSDKQVQIYIKDIRKKILYTNISFNKMKLDNPTKDWTDENNRIKSMKEYMNTINMYEQNNIIANQSKSINMLTFISIIFLPLSLITGFFGMNFKSMGSPTINNGKGPYNFKYGQIYVLFLMLISFVCLLVFYKLYQ